MNQKLFKKLVLLIVIMSRNLFFAQTIKGVVTSNGTTLPGVSVLVEGTSNGTITDLDGAFTLSKVDAKATISFSYVGFRNLKMKASPSMKVAMISDSEKLDEVVVIGYETTRGKT